MTAQVVVNLITIYNCIGGGNQSTQRNPMCTLRITRTNYYKYQSKEHNRDATVHVKPVDISYYYTARIWQALVISVA